MIVDVHAHYISPGAFDTVRRRPDTYGVRLLPGEGVRLQIGDELPTRPLLPALYTLDLHAKFFAAQGIDTAVFGPLMDVAGYSLPPGQGAAWSRLQNEALAAALREAPGAHQGLATVPLQEPATAAAELAFAVRELGLRGAMVDPNALGRPIGDAAFDPFWKAAADLAAPVILHPFLLEAVERFGHHYLHNLVGYPFETTLAAASLILGGTLTDFPSSPWSSSTAAGFCRITSAASTARMRRGPRRAWTTPAFPVAISGASATTRSSSGPRPCGISSSWSATIA